MLGYDHRTYVIIPDGNYFINPVEPGKNLVYSRQGFSSGVEKLAADKLKLGATSVLTKTIIFH